MRQAYRITPRLAVGLAMAGMALIGWVARSTRAQDGPKPSLEVPKVADAPVAVSAVQDSFPSTLVEATAPQAKPSPLPSRDVAATPSPADPAKDDPEQNARAFVERNRKEAQDELKKLKDEAERLRTRLGRVEAGIRRWESLLAALDNSERIAQPVLSDPTLRDTPSHLAPIPVTRPATAVRESEVSPATPADAPPPSSTKPAELPR